MDVHNEIQRFIVTAAKPVLVLLGPTASGKTSLSIEIAKQFPSIEVLNADSRQLYKFLYIGTAKITEAEMRGVPHHFFDVLDPKDEVSVGYYKREAYKKIDELHAQGKVPMLVGGSMLYISAVVDNFALPLPTNPSVRLELEEELTAHGLDYLYTELQRVDPVAAKQIHKHNKQHVVRALEFTRQTGRTKAEVLANGAESSPYNFLQLGITRPRPELVKRINERTSSMFEQGWLTEVQDLLSRGYTRTDPGLMSVGYRECIDYIQSGSTDLPVLIEAIAKQTRDYAKRQMTWWKRDSRIKWITEN